MLEYHFSRAVLVEWNLLYADWYWLDVFELFICELFGVHLYFLKNLGKEAKFRYWPIILHVILIEGRFLQKWEDVADLKCEGKEPSVSDKLIIDITDVIQMTCNPELYVKFVTLKTELVSCESPNQRQQRTPFPWRILWYWAAERLNVFTLGYLRTFAYLSTPSFKATVAIILHLEPLLLLLLLLTLWSSGKRIYHILWL